MMAAAERGWIQAGFSWMLLIILVQHGAYQQVRAKIGVILQL
jgi:hypothetical protein